MAWYLDGNWEGLRVDYRSEILAEFMYAINEREAFLGLKSGLNPIRFEWGSLAKSFPVAADLDGVWVEVGPVGADVSYYVDLIRGRIEYLIGTTPTPRHCTQADGTDWASLSDFLTEAGYGGAWIGLDAYCTNTNIYLQLRAAIELLRYTRHEIGIRGAENGYGNVGYTWAGALQDPQWGFIDSYAPQFSRKPAGGISPPFAVFKEAHYWAYFSDPTEAVGTPWALRVTVTEYVGDASVDPVEFYVGGTSYTASLSPGSSPQSTEIMASLTPDDWMDHIGYVRCWFTPDADDDPTSDPGSSGYSGRGIAVASSENAYCVTEITEITYG